MKYILINCSRDTGIMETGRYDTKEEAAREIASQICSIYNIDIDIDDFVAPRRLYGNVFCFTHNHTHVWFNGYECYCCDNSSEDDWLIVTA